MNLSVARAANVEDSFASMHTFSRSSEMGGESRSYMEAVQEYAELLHQQHEHENRSSQYAVGRDATASTAEARPEVYPIEELVQLPRRYREARARTEQRRTFTALEDWDGFVDEVREADFTVELINVKSKEKLATEEVVFSKAELNEMQRDRLESGAVIRWVIGIQRLPSGTKQRVSELFFRKLPMHTRKSLDSAVVEAEQLPTAIGWDAASTAR